MVSTHRDIGSQNATDTIPYLASNKITIKIVLYDIINQPEAL